MAYSPPLDSVIGALIFMTFLAIPTFIVVSISEIFVLWLFGWGSFLHSLLTSFIMNLVSTVVGFFMSFAVEMVLTPGYFLLLFVLSVGIEGLIMLAMKGARFGMKKVWLLAFISNFISYLLVGACLIIFHGLLWFS